MVNKRFRVLILFYKKFRGLILFNERFRGLILLNEKSRGSILFTVARSKVCDKHTKVRFSLMAFKVGKSVLYNLFIDSWWVLAIV